jgi:tetratricopeptide (TPR) repeat protein
MTIFDTKITMARAHAGNRAHVGAPLRKPNVKPVSTGFKLLSEFYFKGFSNLLTLLLSAALFPTFISIPAFAQFPQTETNPSQLLQQSRTLYENGQFSQAITSLQQAATAFQAIGDTQQQAMALTNLSLAYQQLQQWQDAEAAITKSLNLLQSHPDNSGSIPFWQIGGKSNFLIREF